MAISTYAGNLILDAMLNQGSAQIATAYCSLHSGDPALTGANELSGGSYARVLTEFDAPAAGVTDTTNQELFAAASGDWPEATHAGLFDALSGGNFLIGGAVDTPMTVLTAQVARWSADDLDITFATAFSAAYLDHMLNALFRNTELTVATLYASLHTATPGLTGANELSGNGYARVDCSACFPAADAKSCTSDVEFETPLATGSNWPAATHSGLWAHASETGASYFI
ncbi:MAG TPA: hypothetical protein VM537_04565 [Anaerolineae bacterium]|nr:hypothetical protein [Anaerolineae bacterium]